MRGLCCLCKQECDDVRPYGPGAQPICFPCMKSDPAIEEEAKGHFFAAVNKAQILGGGQAVLDADLGPIPFPKNRGDA